MLGTPPFPILPQELTAQFFSDVLGAEVRSFRGSKIGADRGMLGDIFLLDLDFVDPDRAGPAQIVLKTAAQREGALASARRGRTHERELRCFDELLGDTPVSTPAFYGGWYDDETAQFLLLLEAVEADTEVDQLNGLSIDQANAVVDEMAGLHAHWWRDDSLTALDWLPRLDAEQRLTNLGTLAATGWPLLVDLVGEDLHDVPVDFADVLAGRLPEALRHLAALPHTLLHCDLRADNLLFHPTTGAVTLIDWQGCGIGPAAFDLAYCLTQSLTIEDRRRYEAGLTKRFSSAVQAAGVDDDPLAGFAEAQWYSMAIACALPVISDPTQDRVRLLATEMANRTLAALRDHGQI